uniref:Uncharacterized protein n=1 Tax=Micrurus spixii TaxID=129469 RepID=A0A2D4LIQ7_9SAUR
MRKEKRDIVKPLPAPILHIAIEICHLGKNLHQMVSGLWKQSSCGINISFASSMSYHNQCFEFHYFPHHEMISMMSFEYDEYEVTVESTGFLCKSLSLCL